VMFFELLGAGANLVNWILIYDRVYDIVITYRHSRWTVDYCY
jgi:hypothetical protein